MSRSMPNVPSRLLACVSFAVMLSGCSIVKGIFKAGVWVGVVGVVCGVALIVWLLQRFGGRKDG